MPDGYRIADAYVGLSLNRDQLRADLAALPAEMDGEVDAAGQAMGDRLGNAAGDRISSGVRGGITGADVAAPSVAKGTESGDKFGSAFSSKVRAALASLPPADVNLNDEYAQAKLDEIRRELTGLGDSKINVDVSDTDALARLSAVRAQLDDLRMASASVQVKVDTAAASAQIDKFLADTEVKAEVAGKAVGKNISDGATKSTSTLSPLIVSAIAGGLIAGGPVISAAAVLLFGGLSAAAAAQNAQVKASFSDLKSYVMADVKSIGDQTASQFVAMAGDIEHGFDRVEPAIRSAMTAGAVDIRQVVDAMVSAADTAIPAFNRALQASGPIVQGLDALIRDVGTGVAGFMDQLTAHSGAEGAVLSDLGQIINTLLPILGQLLGEGAELGQTVLPLFETGLRAVSTVLNAIAPVLPEVAAGFAAWKIISTLTGPLGLLSAKMQTVAADAEGLKGKLAGVGAQGAASASNMLPVLGIALAGVSTAFAAQSQQVQKWGQALLDGGNAAAQAKQQIQGYETVAHLLDSGMTGFIGNLTGYGTALNVTSQDGQKAKQAAKDLYDAMSPLEQKQQDVTTATNNLQAAVQKYGPQSDQAAAASGRLSSAQAALTGFQNEVKAATQGATTASQNQQSALQGISDKASAASTQINLLKGALDALTGKAVTADQAEIAVTQAVDAATQAVQGHTAALSFVNGQLDLHNTKSAAAAQALITLAGTQHQEIATLEQQGASQQDVTAKSDQMRQQFIVTAEQMGANAQQAQALADRYFGIPGQVATNIIAYDNSSAVIQRIQNLIAGLHDKNIFITTYNRVVSSGPAGLGGAVQSQGIGGIAVPMAVGGIIPMAAGGKADIFQPNSPTFLIGDNKRVRESFIPQDGSPRSKAILTETASEMGYRLVPNSDGGTVSTASGGTGRDTYNVTVNIPVGTVMLTDRDIPAAVVAALQQALLKKDRASR